jgi:hypothetical protein
MPQTSPSRSRDNEENDNLDNYYDLDDKKSRTVGIRELDLNTLYPQHPLDLKNGSKYVMIGKPGVGKSRIIQSLLYAKKHIFPVGVFWSGTEEDGNVFFGNFVPDCFIRNGTIDANVAAHMKPLEDLNKRQKIARKYLETRGDNPWCVEVLDDCTADPKFLKKTVINDTYKNGRHKAKMHILSLQFCLNIPTEIRGLIDGTFICREGNPKNRLRLFENFGSCVDNINDWNDLMDGLTDDYCAMFINNKSTSNNIEDTIQYYKADLTKIPTDWKFGCREYWDFHYDRYNPHYNPSI